MVAVRDDEGETMHTVHEGVEMGAQITDEVNMISQELDGGDVNTTLRLISILALPQTVVIPRRNRGTPLIDYSKSIIMTSDNYITALEHKQERCEEVAREKEKRKADFEINKSRKAQEKRQKAEEKKVRAEERAEEYGVMWPVKRCTEVGVKLHEAIRANAPLGRGAYRAPCCGTIHPLFKLNQKMSMWRRAMKKKGIPSEKLCPLQEPIWVHYPGAPRREWLATGSSLPPVAQHTPNNHLLGQVADVGGENSISDSQGMIFNLYVHFVKIYVLLNYKRRYVRLTCIFFRNFILDNYNKNDYTLTSNATLINRTP